MHAQPNGGRKKAVRTRWLLSAVLLIGLAAGWSLWKGGVVYDWAESLLPAKHGIQGYVVEVKGRTALIVSSEPMEGERLTFDAVYVSNVGRVQVGQEVQIRYKGGVADSFPAQAGAGKVRAVNPPRPDGARLNRDEALRLAFGHAAAPGLPVVLDIRFDPEPGQWIVRLMDGFHASGAAGEEPTVVSLTIDDAAGRIVLNERA